MMVMRPEHTPASVRATYVTIAYVSLSVFVEYVTVHVCQRIVQRCCAMAVVAELGRRQE